MSISLEALEEKFREVEEASERQAMNESLRLHLDEPLHHSPSRRLARLRKSASVSFLRQPPTNAVASSSRLSTPLPPPRASSRSAMRPTLASFAGFRSFISEGDDDDDDDDDALEGDEHVIEIQRIAGRQSLHKTMGILLPRRLSRTQTRSQSLFMSSNINVVIGVCVERTTADCPGGNSTEQGLTVHVPKPRRARAFTIDHPPLGGTLVQRAKDLARKVRRKGQN